MITQFPSFKSVMSCPGYREGVEFSVWPGCYSVPHTTTPGTWNSQEKPGALTGSWPLLLLLLQQEGDSKGPVDSVLGYFCGTQRWGEAAEWLPVGSLSPAPVQSRVGNGSKGTCTELCSAEQWHDPAQMTQLPEAFVYHCFPLLWAGKCQPRELPHHTAFVSWLLHGNDHPIAFVWGNQADTTHGECPPPCSCSLWWIPFCGLDTFSFCIVLWVSYSIVLCFQ